MTTSEPAASVAIIGGGLSGAAVAWHLARQTSTREIRITIIEPREELGLGLAYSTRDPDHRLNVPDRKMTLDTREPLHFQRWLQSGEGPGVPPGARTAQGDAFVPRAIFGQYVAYHLRPWLERGRIAHVRAQAVGARPQTPGYALRLDDGTELRADRIVLAVSHPAPTLPAPLAGLHGDPRLIADAYATDALGSDALGSDALRSDALASIAPADRVLIIGSGLTGADVVATLHRRGQTGHIHLLSRHGRRSQPHGPEQPASGADFTQPLETTALSLLQRVRQELAHDAQAGLTWHALFDRLREQGPSVWATLPWRERRQVVRHLRGLWDIHRFRIAPQTHQAVEDEIAAGRLTLLAGHLVAARANKGALAVELRLRDGATQHLEVERIVLATGPAHGSIIGSNPLLSDLARQGLLQPDPLGLGLWTSPQGLLLDRYGVEQPGLLVAGPLARGAVGELMGVPEVTAWAEAIAARLAEGAGTAAASSATPA